MSKFNLGNNGTDNSLSATGLHVIGVSMASNLERFRVEAKKLEEDGFQLYLAMRLEILGKDEFRKQLATQIDANDVDGVIKKLPSFSSAYQIWYSNSRAVIKSLLPDRLGDFVRHHEKPRSRKAVTYGDYFMEDYLQGLRVTRGWQEDVVADRSAAAPQFDQMRAILSAALKRLDTVVHDLHQMVQADVFDSELDAAKGLLKMGFLRAAGAVAGVVLERHLAQVAETRGFKIPKANPTISDFNERLKAEGTIGTPEWRHIQLLGDIRNLCDHNKKTEPTKDDLETLLGGVAKVIKTVF